MVEITPMRHYFINKYAYETDFGDLLSTDLSECIHTYTFKSYNRDISPCLYMHTLLCVQYAGYMYFIYIYLTPVFFAKNCHTKPAGFIQ